MTELRLDDSDPFSGQPVGDFYAPFFSVKFLTKRTQTGTYAEGDKKVEIKQAINQATGLEETTFSQGTSKIQFVEDEALEQLRSYATSLEIRNEGGGASFATLTLDPPFLDALKIIKGRLIQWNTILVIEWGYIGQAGGADLLSEKHYFYTQQPSLELSNTDVTIKIVGVDLFGYSAMKRETRKAWKRETHKRDIDILHAMIKASKFKLNATLLPKSNSLWTDKSGAGKKKEETEAEEGGNTAGSGEADESTASAVEQNEKDWVFFARMCHENNADYFTVGNIIYLVDMNAARLNKYAYRLMFFTQPETNMDIPMLAFSTNALDTLFQPAISKQVTQLSVDPDTGLLVRKDHDPQKMKDLKFNEGKTAAGLWDADGASFDIDGKVTLVPNPPYTEEQTGKTVSEPHGKPNRDESAKYLARIGADIANTDAQATIPGVPFIVPMMGVYVVGIGEFSGHYLIRTVTHTLTRGGYECQLELFRNTITNEPDGKGAEPESGSTTATQADSGETASPTPVDPKDIPK